MACACLSPGLYIRSHVTITEGTPEGGRCGPTLQGGGGREGARRPGSFWKGRPLSSGHPASEKWGAARRGQPAPCLPVKALQLQPRPARLVSSAQPEGGDFSARGQWALPVVGLDSCSPAPAVHSLCDLGHVTTPLLASVSSTKWA